MVDLSIVIVSFNTLELTVKCLESVFKNVWKHKIEVIVVDNNSQDNTVSVIKKKFPQVLVIESQENGGFAKGNNLGISRARGEYVLLLNSDTEVSPGSLDKLLDFAKEHGFSISSCKLVYRDGSFQQNGGFLPTIKAVLFWLSGADDILLNMGFNPKSYHLIDEKQYTNLANLDWVGGTAMLIKGEVFDKIGLLDEKIFMYGEDVEFCFRAHKHRIKVGWTNEAVIMHLGGGSTKTPKLTQWRGEFKGLLYLYQKHYGKLASLNLKLLIYLFTILRIIAFTILGKFDYTLTYAKVIATI